MAALMSRWILPSECRYDNPISSSRHTIAISASVNTPGFSFHVSLCFLQTAYQVQTAAPCKILHYNPQSVSLHEAAIVAGHAVR